MHYFYVLYSLKDHKLYKGYSTNVGERFMKHNQGGTKSTKNRRPLILIYLESYLEKQDALAREREAKSLLGGTELKKQLIEKGILNKKFRLFGSAD